MQDLHHRRSATELFLAGSATTAPAGFDHTSSTEAKPVGAVIQLASSVYFSSEAEGNAIVEVMRIGNQEMHCEVEYATSDLSALSGRHYRATSGKLIFAPGDSLQSFTVNLIQNEIWETTLEFQVALKTESLVGATLNEKLRRSRVKILDDDTFPTNRYQDALLNRQHHKLPKFGLLFEYYKMNFGRPEIFYGTMKMVMLDQLHNAHKMAQMLVNIYLVDNVLNLKTAEDQKTDKIADLVWIVVFHVTAHATFHFLHHRKFSWGVAGRSRTLLQKSIIRKFLNLDETARENLHEGAMILAVTRDCTTLVHDGYMNILNIIHYSGELVCLFLFQLLAPPLFDKEPWFSMLFPLLLFPCVMALCVIWRAPVNLKSLKHEAQERDAVVDRINGTVTNYRLVADYSQRAFFVDWFDRVAKRYNKAHGDVKRMQENDQQVAEWLKQGCLAIWTIWGGASMIFDPDVMTRLD